MALERKYDEIAHSLPPEAVRAIGDITQTEGWVAVMYTNNDEWDMHTLHGTDMVEDFILDNVDGSEGWHMWGLFYNGKPYNFSYTVSVDIVEPKEEKA